MFSDINFIFFQLISDFSSFGWFKLCFYRQDIHMKNFDFG